MIGAILRHMQGAAARHAVLPAASRPFTELAEQTTHSFVILARDPMDIDRKSPPFDRFRRIQRLAPERSGRDSVEHARHHLYVGLDDQSWTGALIKVTSKPGLIYQHNLSNEIASLTTINRELPNSPYFPVVRDHGRLRDGRVYMIASLFEELPLATVVGTEPIPARMVANLRATIEVATALADLHRLKIFHVDLNPMNILQKMEKGKPAMRDVEIDPELKEILLRSADQRREERYPSIVEFRAALAAYLERIWPGRSW